MGKPRITLIARADNTGLGSQTWEFARHMKPERIVIIDLTEINLLHNKKTQMFPERYAGLGAEVITINGFPNSRQCFEICQDTDLVYTVEIPYGYQLFTIARHQGVKTVLQYNFEFLDYLQDSTLPHPDLFLAPSPWRLNDAMHVVGDDHLEYLPVPTARDRLPYKQRTKANKFLHIAGHPAHEDRNGTWDVLAALSFVESPITLTVTTQNHQFGRQIKNLVEDKKYRKAINPDITINVVVQDVENYWENFTKEDHDVLLLPRKYGGLSLQRNEAMSCGMPVVMTDTEPNNLTMPKELLVPAYLEKITKTRTDVDVMRADHQALGKKIDELWRSPFFVEQMSEIMNVIATRESWEAMAPKYWEEFEYLCQQ